jgi:hypothetical protein
MTLQHDVKNGRELGQRYAELECPVRIDGLLLDFSRAPHIVVQPQRTGICQESEYLMHVAKLVDVAPVPSKPEHVKGP